MKSKVNTKMNPFQHHFLPDGKLHINLCVVYRATILLHNDVMSCVNCTQKNVCSMSHFGIQNILFICSVSYQPTIQFIRSTKQIYWPYMIAYTYHVFWFSASEWFWDINVHEYHQDVSMGSIQAAMYTQN